MAARHPRLMLRLLLVLGLAALAAAHGSIDARSAIVHAAQDGSGRRTPATVPPQRIISLVPALTEILFAIGGGPQVVAVSSFDTFPPEVEALPRVGALLDPDTERILALRPDMVITYASQAEAEARFAGAGIRVFSYRHGGIANVLDTIRAMGAITGRTSPAAQLVERLNTELDEVRARVRGRPRPRTVLVLERQPDSLRGLYASGGVGFLHEILEVAGGENVFASVARESVQPSHETLIREAPEVIIEIRAATATARPASELERAWSQLASLPAVRNRRVHALAGQHLVIPGPRLGQAARELAALLHP